MEKTEIEMLAGVSNNGISIVYRFFQLEWNHFDDCIYKYRINPLQHTTVVIVEQCYRVL